MPSIVDKIAINNEKLDKRVKLSSSDKKEIVELYDAGLYSQINLAKLYNVSRRTIVFTLYPERREANYAGRVANGGSKQYYDKKQNTASMKIHRNYKKKLLADGKI
ncbi:MAG: hypothetical protein KAS26_03080 [Sulfurimonas sp.]|nr:hypothetical protein [Sulfurimonas sp.]